MEIVWFLTIMYMSLGPGSVQYVDKPATAYETELACKLDAARLSKLYKRPVGFECTPRKDFP